MKITNDTVNSFGGRPVSPESLEARKKILRFAKRGIANPDLAEKLGVSAAKSQVMAAPLVKKGLVEIEKSGRTVIYKTVEQ